MKIRDLFTGKPVISFEIFPPKPDFPLDTVFATLEELKGLNPAYISVTYGAGGSSSARSIEIVDKVKNHYGMETVAHLTCVGATPATIDTVLDRLQALGVENILALRGDPPAGDSPFIPPADGFPYAKDLVRHVRGRGFFSVAAAAYPEGHLECRDIDQDVEYLRLKVEQGVDLLITQLFFDNATFYGFLDKIRGRGIACPVIAGIMPVLSASQIKRITSLCGSAIPAKLQRLMDKYGGVPADMEKAGIEYASEQIVDLLANKVDGIHLYTMNKAKQTKQIMENIGRN
ncbi:methylenetetrahydrofolate reductase [NAD(P)H] [Anaeroselena agilis]|uniref:Methylenetetrahydrofolate reductase n=1 Tax=Anaeroselena agilis TaxID=3063788 RepID=A0ABU3NXZ8_9FIRM|nr:methylenetetrahydrofolate reductase [NAD(P)H] [Selenomonadales bacterium 4137-cl]